MRIQAVSENRAAKPARVAGGAERDQLVLRVTAASLYVCELVSSYACTLVSGKAVARVCRSFARVAKWRWCDTDERVQ